MKPLLRYLLVGAVVYVVALVATFPAGYAFSLAQSALKGGSSLTVAGVQGSIWNGQADALSLGTLPTMRVKWQLNPLTLLTGSIGADWRAESGDAHLAGHVRAGFGGELTVTATEGRIPIELLTARIPLPVVMAGDVRLNIERLEWVDGQPLAAEGVLLWSGARVTAVHEVGLGDIKVTLEPRPQGGILGRLSDGGGPLSASGDITLAADGAYRLNALLGTRPGADEALVNSLPMVGRKAPGGKYQVTFSGRL